MQRMRYDNYLGIQRSKRKKIAVLAIMLVIVILAVALFIRFGKNGKKGDHTLADEIKLAAYENITLLGDQNYYKSPEYLTQWGCMVIEDVMKNQGTTLTEDEKLEVQQNVESLMQSTVAGGNIRMDETGEITSLSKAYIANSLANAVTYSLSDVDTSERVDAGTTTYEQIIELTTTLANVESTNLALIENVDAINGVISTLESSGLDGIAKIDTAALQSELDAYMTDLMASSYKNTSEGDTAAPLKIKSNSSTPTTSTAGSSPQNSSNQSGNSSSNSNDSTAATVVELATTVNEITTTQVQMLTDLEEAADTILQLTEQIKNIEGTTIVSIQESISTMQTDIQNTIQSISSAQTELNTLIEKNKTELSGSIEATKNTLTSSITETKNDLESNLDKAKQELSAALEKEISERESQDEKNKSEISSSLEETKNTLTSSLTEAKSDLESSLDKAKQELSSAMENDKNELTEKMNTTEQSLKDTADKDREDNANARQEIINSIEQLTISVNNEMTSLEVRLTDNITSVSDDLARLTARVDAIETSMNYEISNLQKQLNEYILATDAHAKIAVIEYTTIGADAWTLYEADNSKVYYVVENPYLSKAISVSVVYQEQYDLTPEYFVDETNSCLQIIIPKNQVKEVCIESIVIYYMSDDAPGNSSNITGEAKPEEVLPEEDNEPETVNSEGANEESTKSIETGEAEDQTAGNHVHAYNNAYISLGNGTHEAVCECNDSVNEACDLQLDKEGVNYVCVDCGYSVERSVYEAMKNN